MTISALAAGVAVAGLAIHTFSAGLAAFRCRRDASRRPAPADAPPVSLVQPLCGVEAFSKETLASIFALDYPDYEILFCLADPADPIAPIVRRAMAAQPEHPVAAADRRRPRQRQSQAQQCRQRLEGGGAPLGDRRRFQCADAARLYPAADGALARRHRHRLRAADRSRDPKSSPPKSNARFSTPIRRAGNMPPRRSASASPKARRCYGGATSSRRAAASRRSAPRSPKTRRRPSSSIAPACAPIS